MSDITALFSAILKNSEELMTRAELSPVFPEGVKKSELPLFTDGGKSWLDFAGKRGVVRLFHSENILSVKYAAVLPEELEEKDFKTLSETFFDPEKSSDAVLRSTSNEVLDTLGSVFGKKAETAKKKMPTPVSKSAAKNGDMAYDPNTLANRLCGAYPELKEPYRANVEKYDRFLAEEFFEEHATPLIIATIKENDKQRMKKLFNILNSVFDDGTNETQSLICVSILGKMDNDPELIANASEYMETYLADPAIAVNKYLATAAGKRAKKKLKNPPLYKPKKKKNQQSSVSSFLGM